MCAKGAEFSADIAQVDGAWAPGRSQLVFMRRMSVNFPLTRYPLFRCVERVGAQGGLYAPPRPTEMSPFDF